MRDPSIARTIRKIDQQRMTEDLFYLAESPIPMRKLNLTLPDHRHNTLYEADSYLTEQLQLAGYEVEREGVRVQAFRRDATKPKAQQYAKPAPQDPWYVAYNLYAQRRGSRRPDEIILLLAHKDSQSWVDSPGAYDNAVGTVAILEIARQVARLPTQRTIRFLFCNEEHTPWTSVTAARNARRRRDNLVAIFNTDGLGGKSQQEIDAGVKTNVTLYTVDAGKPLADLMTGVIQTYGIRLRQRVAKRQRPGDDDGSFVKVGYGCAIVNVGSSPYADPQYHREGDVPQRVDMDNVYLATQAILAAVLERDRSG